MISPTELKRVAESIRAELPDVLGVYVFGSTATGSAREGSDVDLAVLAAERLPALRLWESAQSLACRIGCDVDLVDLRAASTVMRVQAIAHGERLVCVDAEACGAFEDFVYADFARLNEERAAILADVRKRRTVYG